MTIDFRFYRYVSASDWELCKKAAIGTMLRYRSTIELFGITVGSSILLYMVLVFFISTFVLSPAYTPRLSAQTSADVQRRLEDHIKEANERVRELAVVQNQVGNLSTQLTIVSAKMDAIAVNQTALQVALAGTERSLAILQFLCSAAVLGCLGTLGKSIWDAVLKKARS